MTTSPHTPSHPRSARSAVLLMLVAVSWLLAACGASARTPAAPGPTAAAPASPATPAAVAAATLAPSATPAQATAAAPTAQPPTVPTGATAAPPTVLPATAPVGATAAPAATSAAPAGTGTVAVSIVEPPFKQPQEWHYDPAALMVNMGETITWTNTGAVLHTVTANDGHTFELGQPQSQSDLYLHAQASRHHCLSLYAASMDERHDHGAILNQGGNDEDWHHRYGRHGQWLGETVGGQRPPGVVRLALPPARPPAPAEPLAALGGGPAL